MKILVVDDSAIIFERLINLISDIPDTEVIGNTKTANSAVELILNMKPDVVILDIRLERGSGIDVLREVKKHSLPQLKTIVLTNYPYPQYRKKCMELGAHYFLDKVSDIEKLLPLLRKMAEKSSNHAGV